MKIFIDESGDVWFKEASSEFFCVALAIFHNDEAIYDFREKMIALRRSLKMKSENEFHYSHLPKKTKYELMNTIIQCEFEFYGIIIQKRKLIAHSIRDKKRFYNYSTSLVINNASEKITEDSEFFIDGSGDRAFRQEISNYLKFKFNDYGKKKIKRIRMVRSESMDEIQLADFLAGCMRRSHEWNTDDIGFMEKLWKQKQHIQIWPQ